MGDHRAELTVHDHILAVRAYGSGSATPVRLMTVQAAGGSRRWVQRIVIRGRRRDLGLGSYPLVSLAEAREAAAGNRKVARAGGDPAARASGPVVPTFAEAADRVIEMHTPGWKNGGKTATQWHASLRDYAMARVGARRVSDITSADVMSILLPIWSTKPVTAKKVRGRIGVVMKWSMLRFGVSSNRVRKPSSPVWKLYATASSPAWA